ncbi:MAG: aspartate carbamoyltransferase catalytic subunit [Pseudomonadota bacterium]|nr:aspartate carbamoyltransferase catalytic subunit [Pseudomonadota bacterium]
MSTTTINEDPGTLEQSDLQLDENGLLRHLLTLQGMDPVQLEAILDRGEEFLTKPGAPAVRSNALAGMTVANLFIENSTRTRVSFELAAKRLGADVVSLNLNTSSAVKGESIVDMIYTLQAMQVDMFVVRDHQPGTQAMIAQHVDAHVSVLNAGEANVSHPTQGLLDLLTIRRHKGRFEALTVAIVGDIAHSRVAMSTSAGLAALGVGELRLISPPELAPNNVKNAKIMTDIEEGVTNADVVMALRIQKERFTDKANIPDGDEYFRAYGIDEQRMKLAAKDAIVMHPGPMNRGIEIDSSVADGPQSVIREQVSNGVAVRMAILELLAQNRRIA